MLEADLHEWRMQRHTTKFYWAIREMGCGGGYSLVHCCVKERELSMRQPHLLAHGHRAVVGLDDLEALGRI